MCQCNAAPGERVMMYKNMGEDDPVLTITRCSLTDDKEMSIVKRDESVMNLYAHKYCESR